MPPRLIEAETSGEDRLRKLFHDLPVEIREAGLLLVVRTLPGSAHAIAAALDRARWPEVAGSVAGDDTLFVAFTDRTSLGRIKRRLQRLAEASTIVRWSDPAVTPLTPWDSSDYHSPPAELQVRGSRGYLEFFPLPRPRPRPRDVRTTGVHPA